MNDEIKAIDEKVKAGSEFVPNLHKALAETIIGQKQILDRLIIALLCNGHVLIEGLPGLWERPDQDPEPKKRRIYIQKRPYLCQLDSRRRN